jgi:homoserine dehydrogenase
VLGFGTVGQGLAELLLARRRYLAGQLGVELEVVGIADLVKGVAYDPDGLDLERALALVGRAESLAALDRGGHGWDALAMARSADIDVLCEATPTDIVTAEPATAHIRAALERGVSVTTTNKGPVALHYHDLAELAAAHSSQLLFEGTVMAGTPLLSVIRETLAGATITEMQGILNGTTNYILTRMEEGLSYEAALAKAQAHGYAEAVPDADVLGHDTLAKVTILANVVLGATLRPADSCCQGITAISAADVAQARGQGRRYKLIGRVWRNGDGVRASVAPVLVSLDHPLAGVRDAGNAVTIRTEELGEVTIAGPGAGRRETGFALLSDLITIARR